MNLSKNFTTTSTRRIAVVAFSTILLTALAAFILWNQGASGGSPKHITNKQPSVQVPMPNATTLPESDVHQEPMNSKVNLTLWKAKFEELAIQSNLPSEERKKRARHLLEAMREDIRRNPSSASAILDFLNSGADVATGLGFSLSDGGTLDEAPSLRTALLDLLAQADPFEAVHYARIIFEKSTIADEWALALRNLAWQNQDGAHSAELRSRLTEMLDNQDWLGQPSGGFLEAFDISVHLGGIEEFRNMASVVKLEYGNGVAVEHGTTHAAYLALDRLTSAAPAKFVAALTDDPGLLAWAPEHRASLVARADVSDPGQRLALERYLETLAQRPEELATFASLFPNRNALLGRALVSTPLPELGFREMLSQDEASLGAVRDWLTANRYPAIETNLREVERRLAGFVEEARKQGLNP
jgi:hypothetical protein